MSFSLQNKLIYKYNDNTPKHGREKKPFQIDLDWPLNTINDIISQ